MTSRGREHKFPHEREGREGGREGREGGREGREGREIIGMNDEDVGMLGHDIDDGVTECSVFVTDIARGVTDEMLKEKFSKLGNVVDAFVVKNKFTGDTKGYGFVKFASMTEVYDILDMKELPRFEDSISHKVQMVKVTMADPKDTLLVVNIPPGCDEEEVVKILTDVGAEPPRKFRFSGSTKSTGYASYSDHEQALRCLKNIQRPPVGVAPAPFTAFLAPPRFFDAKNAPSMKVLFVRGTTGMSSEALRNLFGGTEVVERAVVPVDGQRGGPIGHAFVHFYTTKAAAAAKEKFHGYDYDGKRLTIEWCLPKTVTHKKSPHVPPSSYPYPYPPYYPPYPYYAEYDQSYYQSYSYPPPYDRYYSSGSEAHESHRGPTRRSNASSSEQYYPYPPTRAASSSTSSSYPASNPTVHQTTSTYTGAYPKHSPPYSSAYPPNTEGRGSRSSYPSYSSTSSSTRGSRYIPY